MSFPRTNPAAAEGSYFMGITPTPGTGIIGHAAPTTFDETKPYLLLYNGESQPISPVFLSLHDAVPSLGGARMQLTVVIDDGDRYASGGTNLTVNKVERPTVGVASLGVAPETATQSAISTTTKLKVGAVVAAAASATRRVIDHVVFRGSIDIVEDVYSLYFGGSDGVGSRAATVADFSRSTAPIVVNPGQTLLIHQWAAAQSTGPTFQARFGFVRR